MKVEKNTATKPARISPKMSSTNRFHSTAAKLPDRRSFPQLRTDVDTQGEKHHWSLHRSFIDPSVIPSSILHRPFISPRPPFIDPSSSLHWSLHRSFIDPSSIPSSILHRPFIDPSSTLHWSLHRSFIDPSSILHRPFIDFWSKCWFGADVGDGHFYRESLCENDNSMKQETHKCRFFFQMLIWRWRWRCGSVKENPCARMRIPCQVLIKKVVFSSKILIFHWKSVGLGPKRAFRITF